jgi:MYXO-CTERM domain-containing protein
MRWPRRALVLAVSLIAPSAQAYTVETPITNGCHELITEAALRGARVVTPAAAPLPLETEDDQAMASDLPFSTASDMGDLGAISLLIGVRDNDMKGLLPTDFAGFAIVQGDPTTQNEHCLRSLSDEEPNGTPESLSACKAFILGRVSAALAYLTAGGNPDPNARLGLPVGLSFRGSVTVPLPGFYLCMGQALHALEDGFSHSYREPDSGAVTASLTWLHILDNDLDPAVDGPPHTSVLDECTSLDPLRTVRLARAEDASKELLLAALGPGSTEHRLANAGAVLDESLAYKAGCTAQNHWCNAPEAAYPLEADGCSMHAQKPLEGGTEGAGLLVALGLVAARRRRRASACVGALLATTATAASASDASSGTPCTQSDPAPSPPRFGAYLAAGGALDNTAINVSVAGRFRISPGWLVGVDGEYNPWFSINADGARPGALNFYATLIRRWPPWTGAFGLRSSVHLGSSTILFDLFGVPKYTTGIYLGANLLGAEWKIGHALTVVVDPADVAFPVPQLAGTPFGYLQYRITVGLQWGA